MTLSVPVSLVYQLTKLANTGSEGRSAEEKPSVGLEEMKKTVTGAAASVMGKKS